MNLKLMKLLDRFLKTEAPSILPKQSRFHPALFLCLVFLTIVLCALSANAIFTVSVIAVLLLITAMLPPAEMVQVLKPVPLPVLFAILILLPAVFMGNPGTMLTVSMKVFESVLFLSLFNHFTDWKETTEALRVLHVPSILIFTIDTMIRFLVILGRYMSRILEAVTLRRVGEENWKNAASGGILGLTYLKSQQMADHTAEAMACRCFDGDYRTFHRRKFTSHDLLLTCSIPLLIIWFGISQGMVG